MSPLSNAGCDACVHVTRPRPDEHAAQLDSVESLSALRFVHLSNPSSIYVKLTKSLCSSLLMYGPSFMMPMNTKNNPNRMDSDLSTIDVDAVAIVEAEFT